MIRVRDGTFVDDGRVRKVTACLFASNDCPETQAKSKDRCISTRCR